MTKGRKTGGRDFVPGDPRAGRLPVAPEIKEGRRLGKVELEAIVNKYLWTPCESLDAVAKDPTVVPVERWLASIIAKGLSSGEWSGFEWIAQRLIGRVKDQVEVTVVKPYVIERLAGGTLELGAKPETEE